ncbi:hypothetical protein niasHT_038964 [Heterodera trifolii]|uniref:G-protein coupled receptors family 1 profile domain-containing protein n=1 Tax=Heterodera trifolii TaxID=157864 RepID=A0ABD2I3G0_9BILA
MCTNFVTFAVVFFGPMFIELRHCFWLQFVPTFFVNLLLNAMLSVGIERLFGVLAPFWVNTLNSTVYISTLISLCFAYALYAMVRLFPIREVALELFRNCMVFTGLTILCYAIIWPMLRFKTNKNMAKYQIDYTKRIFKSLLVNVLFVSTGYFLNAGFLILLRKLSLSQVQIVFGTYILGIFTCISAISNPLTLYLFSSDYRIAFNEHLFKR